MKIDRSKVKKGTSEVPQDCRQIIQCLKTCTNEQLLQQLQLINVWYFGKCELYHWIEVLDRFDTILASIARPVAERKWVFEFDLLQETLGKEKGTNEQNLIFQILKFTALLIEHSYARHLYNSIEHLITLLDCANGNIILAVLNLIYVFSKRSNYLSRLPSERKKLMQEKLFHLAQTWGGSEAGCALEKCCSQDVPTGAGNVYFEYHLSDELVLDSDKTSSKISNNRFCVDLKNVHQLAANAGVIMENILKTHAIPEPKQMSFYHRLRLAHAMASYEKRLQFVQARLQALSILVYSNVTVHVNMLVYDGLIEEIVNTLKLEDEAHKLSEVKASCLKTLTAIIHLDRNPRLQSIIDATGAASYHGFLPSLVRQCILHMTNSEYETFPQQLATALFSFLYHLASYESGCESLVASGLMESLLKVVLWPGEDDHITFVTRAVRVIDLITNLDMAAFQTHKGLNVLVTRLESEIKLCSEFHGPVLSSDLPLVSTEKFSSESPAAGTTGKVDGSLKESSDIEMKDQESTSSKPNQLSQCLPQRAALLKSILNFLKKAIPDPAFADYTRSLMDDNLQNALKLIISNAEYYGALLFLLATDVVTVFIFHEPSLLSSLQDSGLTWVVLKALVVKDVPATRENLASLPNTLSALCLNSRGLEAFVSCKPFDRLFQILISPEYLPAMKRRRSSDPTGETAMHLGSAMDELMRHQPTLKTDAMKAIIRLLERLGEMGRDPKLIAFTPSEKIKPGKSFQCDADATTLIGAEDPLSDDDEGEFTSLVIRKTDRKTENKPKSISEDKKTFVPLDDYVVNVTKFLDNILSNNGTDDHCTEFVRLDGLKPLYELLNMPIFPLEFPLMQSCQSIAPVCKSISMLAQESKVFKEGLSQLDSLLDKLDFYYAAVNTNGSVLLKELANTDSPMQALYDAQKTPLVHLMSTVHAYVNTFVFVNRGALSDVRSMSIQEWGSKIGRSVLEKLCVLYTKLVWESSTLLTLCMSNSTNDENIQFAQEDLHKLTLKNQDNKKESVAEKEGHQNLSKWLLTSSSHLGRALAELFGILVHQCIGTQSTRTRRHPQDVNQPGVPSVHAQGIADRLAKLLVQGLNWTCPKEITIPRLRLTFYICSVGFATPMLFDNSKNPYHLMLQRFEMNDGLDALFGRFRWVLNEFLHEKREEDIKNAVGIREFVEGWLELINRMVNTKDIFESRHSMPATSTTTSFVPFDSVAYMAKVHKYAFDSIMLLWKNKILEFQNNSVLADRMLSILSHIIKGENCLRQKFVQRNKQNEKKIKTTSLLNEIQKTPAPTTYQNRPEINESYLQQFVDMGFPQQHARDALLQSTNNFEAATEYLLTTPAPALPTTSQEGSSSEMTVDLSEEDMMIRAIAMSLGQGMSQDASKETDNAKKKISEVNDFSPTVTIEDLNDFSQTITNNASDIVNGCLGLVFKIPNAVHTVCDLLIAIARRSGGVLYDAMLNNIVEDITNAALAIKTGIDGIDRYMKDEKKIQQVIDIRKGVERNNLPELDKEEIYKVGRDIENIKVAVKKICESSEAITLSTRLHLYLLMFQEIENSCAYVMQERGCFIKLIELLEKSTNVLKLYQIIKDDNEQLPTPDFLAPLLLTFDHYERAALFSKRKQNQVCSHTWKWFDDRMGRWCNYSVSNNTSIDTAYHADESTVRFTAGRRKYLVLFKTLVQINEDTGNRRPIMLDVIQGNSDDESSGGRSKTDKHETAESSMDKLTSKAVKRKHNSEKLKMDVDKKDAPDLKKEEIHGLHLFQKEHIIESIVDLLGFPANAITLNAVIRLSLRLTRDTKISHYFVTLRGVENLLNLNESSSFPGAMPLITLLLRHVVEDDTTMKSAVERAVSVAANNGVPNLFCGVGQNSLGAKELHYLLRALGPIACRNPKLYEETVQQVFRLTLPNTRRGQLEEVIPPNSAQIVKVPQEFKVLGLGGSVYCHPDMERFINLLLRTLVERHFSEAERVSSRNPKESSVSASGSTKNDNKRKCSTKVTTPQVTLVRRLTGEHIDEDEMTVSHAVVGAQPATSSTVEPSKSDQPLLTQAMILLLLTELAKSYSAVAYLVVNFTVGLSGTEKFQGPMLAFTFDYLLPHASEKEAKDKSDGSTTKETKSSTISTLARSLLSVLGAYWHNAEILNIFVTELKNALGRALHLPECKIKHQRLQAIFNLITSMIEFASPVSFSSQPPLQNSQFIKMLIKRGLISDLARCPHSLDLSSQDLVATVNVMLKPLEKLSNLASNQSMQSSKTDKDAKQVDGSSVSQQATDFQSDDRVPQEVNSNDDDSQDEDNAANVQDLQELDDIVGELLGANDEPEMFGSTLVSQETTNDGVEERIYIEANPVVDDSSDSSDSDNGLSDNISEGNDYSENQESLFPGDETNHNTISNSIPANENNSLVEVGMATLDTNTNDDNAVAATFDIVAGGEDADTDDSQIEDAFMIGRSRGDAGNSMVGVDEDEEEDDDDDDDETDDEDGNDDDDGSEMDADDTIANADNVLIFGDEDENEDANDPFANLDEQTGTLEITFPRRPFGVQVPQFNMENLSSATAGAQSRASILSHPLLLRSNDQISSTGTAAPVSSRTHGNRRGFSRQGAIHMQNGPNSGSFARILIGEDLRPNTQTSMGNASFSLGDDMFFDIFGDANETNSGLLNSIPSALSRWTVESRLLDGSSVHDCVNSLKPAIIKYLENLQNEELKEKIAEEKKKKEENEKKKQHKSKEKMDVLSDVTSVTTGSTAATNSSVLFSTEPMDTMQSRPSQPPHPLLALDYFTTPSASTFATVTHPERLQGLSRSIGRTRPIRTSGTWIPPLSPSLRESGSPRFITPVNPLPEVLPNAPERMQPVMTSSLNAMATPAGCPSTNAIRSNAVDIASSLGVVPEYTQSTHETPADVRRLNQGRSNQGLTGDLGFTPITNTPAPELHSMASILATPSGAPSISQLRNNLMFSQGATPRYTNPASSYPTQPQLSIPLARSEREGTVDVSNCDEAHTTDEALSTTSSSALASDLAAAIMSQLVTSSPTPVVTTSSQSDDVTASTSAVPTNQQLTTTMPPSVTATESRLTAATTIEAINGPSTGVLEAAEQIQRELESLGIPEGVDPSFLAALPDNIREEVLREQFGIRLRRSQGDQAGPSSSNAVGSNQTSEPQEVSPEFLAALPPEVQQEVLEQQRLEQARFNAAQQGPEEAVDPAEFVRNLNPTLRRQVLADMDDSLLAVLPPELSSEAQGLRREIEERRLQMQTDRGNARSDFSQLLRHTGLGHRATGGGFQFARLFPRGPMSAWRVTDGPATVTMNNKKVGRQLLDPESLSCLLILLFLNDNTLNASRLHRILRNLSYHNSTKQWIILALISILRRTSSFHQEVSSSMKSHVDVTPVKHNRTRSGETLLCEEIQPSSPAILTHNQWLSRTLNLAFGGCVNIFQLQKVGKRSTDYFVTVHQQACLDVCKQVLEALSFLAKNFPSSFAPLPEHDKKKVDETTGPSYSKEYNDTDHQSEFWDILVRLNSSSVGLKGKVLLKSLREFPKDRQTTSFVTSPLGQILSMLSHPVVKQSTMLTDKLLRLLAVISVSLPERPKHLQAQPVEVTHQSDPNARPPGDDMSQPLHTVTFADRDNIVLPPHHQPSIEDDRYHHAAEISTVCSETTSVTSSLLVEPPEAVDRHILLPPSIRSPLGGSVVSAVSDGTVAQSDFSAIGQHEEHDAMDVDQTSQPISDTSSIDNRSDQRSSPGSSMVRLSPVKEPRILIGQLRMAVNVLTGGTCSDEGLEDATTLLLQLSRTESLTRDCILELLLEGTQEIANVLQEEIKLLLHELKEYNATHSSTKTPTQEKSSKQLAPVVVNRSSSRSQPWRGRGGRSNTTARRLQGFGSNQPASRRNAPKPVIYDLHLPIMATLTAKRCGQSLFLRVLKVILQLREAARKNAKKSNSKSGTENPRSRGIRLIERLHHGGSSLREFVAALEADMEAMYEMIDRFGGSSATGSNVGNNVSATTIRSSNQVSAGGSGDGAGGGGGGGGDGGNETSTTEEGEKDSSKKIENEPQIPEFPRLSTQLMLDDLWDVLGEALSELAETSDTNAVLVLQPAVEAFFLVHGSDKDEEKTTEAAASSISQQSLEIPPSPGPYSPGSAPSPSTGSRLGSVSSLYVNLPPDSQKFLRFAETHRTVLNQILRQSNSPLADGPFAVLVNHTRLLDFDVKRRYFRQQLEKEDKGHRREDMAVHIRREHVFEDSYRELHRRTAEELKNRLYIVFDGEEGQDAGGLLREWYGIMAREMFNPDYALFTISQGEKATYLPNRNSHCNPNHLSYFKFAGRIVAKAIYDNKLLDCYFTRSFYKHILGKPVHYTDMEAEDYGFYQGLVYLLEHDIDELGYELTFSLEMQVFGLNEVHDLKPNGRNIPVTEETKREYVKLVCREKMAGSIGHQISSFLEGFYEIIPRRLISIFDEQELELLVAGLPTIDIEDLKANTEYHKYTDNSLQIQWFWRALRSFDQADRAKFLQFVTGTSKVPLQGFATLEGMNGVQKFQIHRDDRSTDRLPCAHTCFNQLDLPAYETYDKLNEQLTKAIHECPEGFGLA